MARGRIIHFLVVALSSAGTLAAQQEPEAPSVKQPLRLSIKPVGLAVRAAAPLLVDVEVICQRPSLVRGILDLTFYEGLNQDESRRIGQYISDELAVTEMGHRFRMMLPPMSVSNESEGISIVAQFLTDEGPIKIGEKGDHQLRVPAYWKRVMLLAICAPREAMLDGIGVSAFRALKLEQFDPDYEIDRGLLTSNIRFDPADMPEDPLEFFAYDLLIVSADGFAQLKSAQLDAIDQWVEAGGRLLVFAERGLTVAHKSFLNRLARGDGGGVFLLDERGGLRSPDPPQLARTPLCHVGLGRAVVLRKVLTDADLTTPAWRRIAAFLWSVRNEQLAKIERAGFGDPVSLNEDDLLQSGMRTVYQPVGVVSEQYLPELLLSDGHVQKLPPWMVLTILALFLLAIAPGDYYLLGYLKARKYTWILFPATSIAFTIATVALAERHLGHNDHVRSLVFVDMVPGNRAARTSRFEVHFTASQKDVVRDVKRHVFAEFKPSEFVPNASNKPQYAPANPSRRLQSIGLIHRNVPQSYAIARSMQQWASRTTRYTAVGTDVALPAIDWDSLDTPALYTGPPPEQVGEEILRHLPDASFYLSDSWQHGDGKGKMTIPLKIAWLIRACSIRGKLGLFELIARTSPNGAGNLEDLALLDETNPKEQLLIVAWRDGNDIIVIRRLYRQSDRQTQPLPQIDRDHRPPTSSQEQN